MRHFLQLDIDNPFQPEIILIVNGVESKMSYHELHKLMLDCEWAYDSIKNAQRVNPIKHYRGNDEKHFDGFA